MRRTVVETYRADIYCGLRPGYASEYTAEQAGDDTEWARALVQKFVDSEGLGVTFTPTEFLYKHGSEPGLIVGLIHYPRFPTDPTDIQMAAVKLAGILKAKLKQERVTVVCTDVTIMLGEP
jgi:hypothetical protein